MSAQGVHRHATPPTTPQPPNSHPPLCPHPLFDSNTKITLQIYINILNADTNITEDNYGRNTSMLMYSLVGCCHYCDFYYIIILAIHSSAHIRQAQTQCTDIYISTLDRQLIPRGNINHCFCYLMKILRSNIILFHPLPSCQLNELGDVGGEEARIVKITAAFIISLF